MAKIPAYERLDQRIQKLEQTALKGTAAGERQRYKSIIERIEDGYYEVDIAGNFTFFNGSMCKILGYSRDELTGMNNRRYMDEKNSKIVFNAFNQVYKTGTSYKAFDWELIRKDGSRCYVETSVVLIEDSKGQPIGFQGIARDITERKRAEEKLLESQKILRTAIEQSPSGIIIADAPNVTIRLANRAAFGIRGGDKSILTSIDVKQHAANWQTFLPDGSPYPPEQLPLSRAVLKGEVTKDEEIIIRDQEGQDHWVSANAAPIRDDKGQITSGIVVFHDITDRKRAEQELTDESSFQRVLGEIANEFINISSAGVDEGINRALKSAGQFANADRSYVIRFDLQAGTLKNTHEWCRAGIEPQIDNLQDLPVDLFRWVIDQLVNLQVVNIPQVAELPPEAKEVRDEFAAEGIRSVLLVPLVSEGRCLGTVGFDFVKQTKWCADSEIKLLKMLGATLSNVLDRKQAEVALRQSEERYKTLTNNLHVGIYRNTPGSKGKFIEANPAIVEIFGYESRKEFMAVNVANLYQNPENRNRFKEKIAQYGSVNKYEVKLKKKDGTPFVGSISAVAVKDANGNTKYYDGVIEDITGKRELELQLQQAQKMEAIGTLAGGIAHDFNNILSAIIGYTELSLNSIEKGSNLYQNLMEICRAGGRARDLVKQILTFSRQAEQELKPVHVKLISKEAIKFLRASLPTTIEIHQEIESDSLVMADPTQIHQVLMNLCANAGHAMREKGGVLEVKLKDVNLGEEAVAEHPELKPGPYLKLTISDSGHGIPPHILERIFDPFFTTKEKSEGTGMGLSVVHGIVGSYGGKILANSQPGQGSTFIIYLPAVERDRAPLPVAKESLVTGTEWILFVDDEPALVKIGKQMLESLGYRITGRTSSLEALGLFKAKADRFDLVITDMTMPNMAGDEFARELLRINPKIPIILCTGYSTLINQQKAAAMGIRALVSKPVLRKEIAETIRKVIDGQRV
jgi:PAS domain S-box-containing protein